MPVGRRVGDSLTKRGDPKHNKTKHAPRGEVLYHALGPVPAEEGAPEAVRVVILTGVGTRCPPCSDLKNKNKKKGLGREQKSLPLPDSPQAEASLNRPDTKRLTRAAERRTFPYNRAACNARVYRRGRVEHSSEWVIGGVFRHTTQLPLTIPSPK